MNKITERINPDGSITVGIIEEEAEAPIIKVEPKAETKKAAPKKSAPKKTK